MTVVSVDLAYRSWKDIGVAVLHGWGDTLTVDFRPLEGGSGSRPTPEAVADRCIEVCNSEEAHLLLLDGPQGWKSADNGHVHARDCERKLNTPAKTGLPGTAKPRNYLPFVSFSIAVFDALAARGWPRLEGDSVVPSATIESFPLVSWAGLSLPTLPAKSKSSPKVLETARELLEEAKIARLPRLASHDELQAVVAGIGGLAFEHRAVGAYRLVGLPPRILDDTWREGFILVPGPRHPWNADTDRS